MSDTTTAPAPPRTVEEIYAALEATMTAAEGRQMTSAEMDAYEALEGELQVAQRRANLQARHTAYSSVAPASPGLRPSTGARQDDGLERAFESYLRTGRPPADLSDQYVAAQSEGTGSEGGYLVPDGFRARVTERLKAYGGIAGVAEEITTSTGVSLPWPTVDDTSNSGEIVEENGTFSSGADITFGERALDAYEYASSGASSNPIRVSWALLQDAAFDVQGLVSRLLSTRIARIQATHLATGNGSKQPLGLLSGLTGANPAASTGITYNDLVGFVHEVDPAYRAAGNCRWVFNDTSLSTIEQMQDSNGDPLWRTMLATMSDAASYGRLLGYPITIDQGCPDIDPDNSAVNWGAFGDIMAGYVVRRVRGIVIVVNPYSRTNYRQTEFTAWARMDATQQDTHAYTALAGLDAS